ncbi:hypothetical protein K438DRAFT_1956987 [Mycena galopus ATCC 62051]|nr:hypothetical protein K438DRAFT_1956987 [Mycena galopus ATCC 62051]
MRLQEPPFPSFSFVLSQPELLYSESPPAQAHEHLVFPWTPASVTYPPPLAVAATPNPSLPPPSEAQPSRGKFLAAIRRFFAAIILDLKARR